MAGLGAVTWREPQGAFHKKIDRLLDCVHENPVPIIIFTGGGDGGLHHDHGRAIRALLSTPALQCPTLVTLHPAQLGRVGRPCLGKAACLQGILPGVRGAPARSLDNGGVDRPPAHGRIVPFLEMRVKPGEQRIYRLRPGQVFAQQPDRPRVTGPKIHGVLAGVRLEYNPKAETGHVTMANRGIEGQRMAPGRRVTDPGLPESALQFPNTACSTS